jgi:AAA domain/DnaB-like helicase N terminal domain
MPRDPTPPPVPLIDVELERVVIDCVLHGQLDACRAALSEDDFYYNQHRAIWREAIAAHDAGEPVELLTIIPRLERTGAPQHGEPWRTTILATVDVAPVWANAATYAANLAELAHRRAVAHLARLVADEPTSTTLTQKLAATLAANGARAPGAAIELRAASSYGRRAVRWLTGYEGFFPLGMLSLLVGYQGDGKTLVVCLIAANESQHGRPVVIATTEDEVESVMRPRLEAAGANLDLVSFVSLQTPKGPEDFYLPEHGAYLVEAIEKAQPSLLVIDPMEAFLGSGTDSWKSPDIRRALRPISACAERAGCAAIVVGYMNRDASTKFLDRVAESMAFSRASRSAVLLWPDPDDPDGAAGSQRILALGKTNLAPRGTASRRYTIEGVILPHVAADPAHGLAADLEQVTTARIVYTGEGDVVTADELLARSKAAAQTSKRDTAEALLEAMLGDGDELPQQRLVAAAEVFGIHERTLRRALSKLGGETRKAGRDEGWLWRLSRARLRARA